ncbi:outer membrane lipoprotein carrier protein LolA [Methylophaga sp. OBS3]|uniref:outer membrane lipoprotein carrier protein LolA n=1 Tax=Methylophaga sp. OBS3 TaxID=2991934 RepID=UPI00224F9DCC|nr:outer membrane lipoprotein carrier protein LolA [Methylophaga sp. OBS3]MCX4189071.1 outer membrane lipoprotein carrier protein LolA [Methylophaga sp. OBS3]
MKRLILALCLLLAVTTANAELSYELLAKLTDAPQSLSGKFQQEKTLTEFDVSIMSNGHFVYERDAFIEWITEAPIESQLKMTPDSITSHQGQSEMLSMDSQNNPAVKVISQIFFAVMTAEWDTLADYFDAVGEQQDQRWTVTLTPKEDTLRQTISGVVLQGDKLLKEVTLLEANGDKTHIKFSDLTQ